LYVLGILHVPQDGPWDPKEGKREPKAPQKEAKGSQRDKTELTHTHTKKSMKNTMVIQPKENQPFIHKLEKWETHPVGYVSPPK